MYFKSAQELVEFFNRLDLENSTLVFKEGKDAKEEKPCACKGHGSCQCPPKKVEESLTATVKDHSTAIVESFSERPSFNLYISEDLDENIFYVKDYEAIENACGTGRIELAESFTFMNMCEVNNKATVHLDVVVENKRIDNMPFTLVRTTEDPYLVISKSHVV